MKQCFCTKISKGNPKLLLLLLLLVYLFFCSLFKSKQSEPELEVVVTFFFQRLARNLSFCCEPRANPFFFPFSARLLYYKATTVLFFCSWNQGFQYAWKYPKVRIPNLAGIPETRTFTPFLQFQKFWNYSIEKQNFRFYLVWFVGLWTLKTRTFLKF